MPLLRPCKKTAAFEALPDADHLALDLDALQVTLQADGWRPVVNAAVMLIVQREIEASVYRSGRMLLKTRDPDTALAAFAALHPHIEPEAPHTPVVEGLERLDRVRAGAGK